MSTADRYESRTKSLLRDAAVAAPWLAALLAAMLLHVWFPPVDAGMVNDTYNVDVGGRNAFYQFAGRRLPDVRRNHQPLAQAVTTLDPGDTLCLLGPARYPTPREWDALLNWVRAGGNLLLAARWDDPELSIPGVPAKVVATKALGRTSSRSGTTERESKSEDQNAAGDKAELREAAGARRLTTTLLADPNVEWRSMGAIEVEGTERPRRDADNGFGVGTRVAPRENAAIETTVLITLDGSPQAVSLQLGWGRIVLIASDNVFSNASLAASDKENGALAVRLLEAAGVDQKVVFDESLNATGTPRVVGVLLDPTLRPMTLQLAVVLIAFGWRGSRRFGGVLPQSAPARHDVSLHTDALGNLYYKSRNGAVALRAYLEQLQTALHLRFAAGHERRAIAALAERVGQPVDEVQRLLKTARETARRASVPRHEAATLIRRLSELRKTTSPTR